MIDGVDVRCAPLRVWTRAKRENAWESVPPKDRKNLSNKFGEWLGAYWALTHEDALPRRRDALVSREGVGEGWSSAA